jgi:SAM-dependent methyltransferase
MGGPSRNPLRARNNDFHKYMENIDPKGDSLTGSGSIPASHCELTPENTTTADPLAVFLADPDSHLSDLLYIYFRIYKKRVMFRFLERVLTNLNLKSEDHFRIADVGASMGFDALYLLRRWTRNFRDKIPCRTVELSLLEGDQDLIEKGTRTLSQNLPSTQVSFRYHHHPLVEAFPLEDNGTDLALCSEVVEHLERPGELLQEIYRILKPGGFLILTTDNSPSFMQHLRRVPVWLSGNYAKAYTRPTPESEICGHTDFQGRKYPIYGHINLNPTRVWEKMGKSVGFQLADYGTYESIRRGGGGQSPLTAAFYFLTGAIVYYLLPRRIGRFFGDTTALLLRKPV